MRNLRSAILMKIVCSYDGKNIYPKKVYVFQSFKNVLFLLFCREDVVTAIKKRENVICSGILIDITDGFFYQNFIENDGVQKIVET